ncbi:hypothetical protein AB0H34_45340 [Saccharopolyspora shandongensis]|uniref:hypothetical protein n=1 Tax=Saccharopolyspora shandongensis TaxID=418495 RepID=UPI0033E0F0E2
MLTIQASSLMLGLGVLFVGFVLTTAGASVVTLEPVVSVPPPGQQQPTSPTEGTTETTSSTTEGTSETTSETTIDTGTPTPEVTETAPGGGGGGGVTGTEGMGQPGPDRAPVHPVATEADAQLQLNAFGAVPMWIGLATQFVGLMTAVFSCLAAWTKTKSSAGDGRSPGRIDRKRHS